MKRDCSRLFWSYRELARHIWNSGFWPSPDLRNFSCVHFYRDAVGRLFEAMVLVPLGYDDPRIQNSGIPGEGNAFFVESKQRLSILVDRHAQDSSFHEYSQAIGLPPESRYDLRFLRFFDWDQMSHLDFRFLEVRIEQADLHPDLVGHLALVEVEEHSISVYVRDGV